MLLGWRLARCHAQKTRKIKLLCTVRTVRFWLFRKSVACPICFWGSNFEKASMVSCVECARFGANKSVINPLMFAKWDFACAIKGEFGRLDYDFDAEFDTGAGDELCHAHIIKGDVIGICSFTIVWSSPLNPSDQQLRSVNRRAVAQSFMNAKKIFLFDHFYQHALKTNRLAISRCCVCGESGAAPRWPWFREEKEKN